LIFFHELGHFLIAKVFNVRVLKFSLGFGPKLVGKKVGETEYLVSLVPLGGYVKMLGESGDEKEASLTPEEKRVSFSNQHVLKRIAIVAAGPIFNLFLALLTFCIFYFVAGNQVMIPEIGQVREGSPAFRSGLQKGDVIVSVQGRMMERWSDIKDAIQKSPGKDVAITVKRGKSLLTLTVVPEEAVVKNIFGEEIRSALIGVVASGKFQQVTMGLSDSVREGFKETWGWIKLTCLTIVKLFQRVVPIKTLGGPILIGQMTGQLAQENWAALIPFTAVISVNLGILNLLPIPILDGGVIIFLLIELLIGKPLSFKKRDLAQKVGLFLLIMLMAVVIYNDMARVLE
jgi:regulator of sigma E protease